MRVLVYLLTLLFKFLLGAAHLLQEPLAGVQSCIEGCRCQPSGIHVALPVGTYDQGVSSSEIVRPKGSLNSWAIHSRLYTASRMAMSARSLF